MNIVLFNIIFFISMIVFGLSAAFFLASFFAAGYTRKVKKCMQKSTATLVRVTKDGRDASQDFEIAYTCDGTDYQVMVAQAHAEGIGAYAFRHAGAHLVRSQESETGRHRRRPLQIEKRAIVEASPDMYPDPDAHFRRNYDVRIAPHRAVIGDAEPVDDHHRSIARGDCGAGRSDSHRAYLYRVRRLAGNLHHYR